MYKKAPRNRLLLALPSRVLRRLVPDLEDIPCPSGQVLLDADSSLDYIFFPHSGVISVVAVYANGNTIEMATIGREGMQRRASPPRRQDVLGQALGPNPGQRRKDIARGVLTRRGVDAVLPRPHVRLC